MAGREAAKARSAAAATATSSTPVRRRRLGSAGRVRTAAPWLGRLGTLSSASSAARLPQERRRGRLLAFPHGCTVARDAAPTLQPEEYAASEKYQLRHWDLDRADSLAELIALVNRARRENPAL
jgi:hypothetical protein